MPRHLEGSSLACRSALVGLLAGCFALLFAACTGSIAGTDAEAGDDGGGAGARGTPGAGGGRDTAGPGEAARSCRAPRQIVKLSPDEMDAVLVELIPNATPVKPALLTTVSEAHPAVAGAAFLDMPEPHVQALFDVMESLGSQAVARLPEVTRCLEEGADATRQDGCVRAFIDGFAARAYRRPLQADERESLLSFFAAERAASDARTAFAQVVRAVLLSPNFLYRTELGQTDPSGDAVAFALSSAERASAMAFTLTGAPPDAELRAAVETGAFAEAAEMVRHVRRLLSSRQGAPRLAVFLARLFRHDGALSADLDEKTFAGFAAAQPHMTAEVEAFIEEVLWARGARIDEFLRGRFTHVNQALARLYGLPTIPGAQLSLVDLGSTPRAGLLTQGAFLAGHAQDGEANPVARGHFVWERMLCGQVPAPPPDVPPVPEAEEGLSRRQALERHSSDPVCASCHRSMDPFGLALDVFDAAGRHRQDHNGLEIVTSGRVELPSGALVAWDDHLQMLERLAATADYTDCFARHAVSLALAHPPDDDEACLATTAGEVLRASDGNFLQALEQLYASEPFGVRR